MQNFKSNKQAKGFSLLELMLVLAAIVVLGAIVFQQYNKFRVSQQASQEAQNLAAAATAIKGLYTSGNYISLDAGVAANANLFPDDMINGTTVTNQFGGAVTVGPVAATSALANAANAFTATAAPSATNVTRYFGIQYADVPSAVCVKLATAAAPTFDKVQVGTTIVKNTSPGITTANRRLMDEASVATACTGAATVNMVFVTN